MGLFKEIDFFGVYLPPFFGCVAVTAAVCALLSPGLDRLVVQRYVWNRPLFDAAVFLILLALTISLL